MNAQTGSLRSRHHCGGWPTSFVSFTRWPGARRVVSMSWRVSLTVPWSVPPVLIFHLAPFDLDIAE